MATTSFELSKVTRDQWETLRVTLPIVNTDGSAKDLTAALIGWNLYNTAGASVLPTTRTVANNGITFDGSPTLGRPTAEALYTEMDNVPAGTYRQVWSIIDSFGDRLVWRGEVELKAVELPVAA